MENIFSYIYHIPGSLTANIQSVFSIPFDCTLIHVSAVASNINDAALKLGTIADDDAYLASFDIGDSNIPQVKSRMDFVEGQYPHISAGTNFMVTLDYDGSSGIAAQNVTIALTFAKG